MPEATEAEVDARLDEELNQLTADETEQGADASATEVAEAEQAEAVIEHTINVEDLQAQLDTATQAVVQLGAEVQALTKRIEQVEDAPAAEETAGQTEAAEMGSSTPVYQQNPINARVAEMLGKK